MTPMLLRRVLEFLQRLAQPPLHVAAYPELVEQRGKLGPGRIRLRLLEVLDCLVPLVRGHGPKADIERLPDGLL